MHQYQWSRAARRFRATNENASGFASKVPTITEPTNDGVLNLTENGILIASRIKLWPFGLGNDDDASSMRVIGWHRALKDGSTTLWVPTVIGEFACTFSTAVGVAGAVVLDTERFADTITPVAARVRDRVIGAGTAINSNYEILSPTGNLIAHIIMPIAAFEKLEVTSDQTTGTATFNCLYSLL